MKKAKFIPGCVFLTAAMLSLVACGTDKELPGDSNYITQSSGVDFDGDGIADHLYIKKIEWMKKRDIHYISIHHCHMARKLA